MAMSKQDFETIAETIRDQSDLLTNNEHIVIAVRFSAALADTNPRFDRGLFVKACMPRHIVGTSREAAWDRAVERAAVR